MCRIHARSSIVFSVFPLIPVILFCPFAGADPIPVVPDNVPDSYQVIPVEQEIYDGHVGGRLYANLHTRLLNIDVDELLYYFRHRGGGHDWDGEYIGKFIHAASYTWRHSGNAQLKAKLDYAVDELIATQEAGGYLGTYLPQDRWTRWDVWTHKYDMIGLLAYYRVTGEPAALEASRRVGHLLCSTFGPGRRDINSAGMHVGMAATCVLEPMVMLYRHTGEQQFLDFCYYILSAWEQSNGAHILTKLLSHTPVNQIANAKAYEMLSNIVGLADLYRITGNQDYLTACENAWDDITGNRLYATGTSSYGEYFKGDFDLAHGPDVGEGCVTVTWLQLNWHLLRITGETKYANELERTLYNALLGSQHPVSSHYCYFTPINGDKVYNGIVKRCCMASLPRGIAMIGATAFGLHGGEPAFMQYLPGRYEADITVPGGTVHAAFDLIATFPHAGSMQISVEMPQASPFMLKLRVPAWCDRFTAQVGQDQYSAQAGQFVQIDRLWQIGDIVNISMDLTVSPEEDMHYASDRKLIRRGPQIMAMDDRVNQSPGLPPGWSGDQQYDFKIDRGGQVRTLWMVPFADAGQTDGRHEIMLEPFTLLPQLAAPDQVQIISATAESIELTWRDNSHDPQESGFVIQRRPVGSQDTWQDVGSVSAGTTQFTDTTLIHGLVRYTYRIGAYQN